MSDEIIDTKTCDTSADQVWRFFLRCMNALWTFILFLGVWPLGIAWAVGSIAFMVWNNGRRARRYSRNAIRLREMQWHEFQQNIAPRLRENDHRYPPEWGR
ncbi:membrane protein [Rhodococcus phage Reynauld]|uniref:Membrane protein n=1 Tax=Rhodococcus phage Reynauld TaxID=3062845 RepID=A0ACD4UJA2_9CAUD|nr:membrane protein [Rhodococcus phage Reynauld]